MQHRSSRCTGRSASSARAMQHIPIDVASRDTSGPGGGIYHLTDDRATAKLWARELAAGRSPSLSQKTAPDQTP